METYRIMPDSASSPTPRRIGIMAELTGTTSLAPMVEAAINRLTLHNFETLVVSSGRSKSEELAAWDALARSDCSGFIVHSDCLDNDQLAKLMSTRSNVVLVNLENTQTGKLAAAHLLAMGHHDVAMVMGPVHRYRVQHAHDGFVQHIKEATSSPIEVLTLENSLTEEGGAKAMSAILESKVKRPTAVFFQNNAMAIGALHACRENGVRVPDDISLLSCTDLTTNTVTRPNLSSITQPLKQIGENAAIRVLNLTGQTGAEPGLTEPEKTNPSIMPGYSVRDRSKLGTENADGQISMRERECLQWAAKGKTSWEISQILGITESTIIYHLRNATRKLDAANRLHAVAKALEASIIDF